MQPYLFPYIGYFQMINAVDKFVFYDDVNFIKKGWVNRNRILVNNREFTFSVPLNKISQNITIGETYINLETFESWKEKIKDWFIATPLWVKAVISAVVVIIVYQSISSDMQPFIYFQF